MMNLKFSICSWILLFFILSSDTHAEETYSGPLIEPSHPLHPDSLCYEAVNREPVSWLINDEICSGNIRCRTTTYGEEITLPRTPENGVICGWMTGKNPRKLACWNGECLFVAN